MKTIVIVGAGPNLGVALGKAFGAAGYKVALIGRRKIATEANAAEVKKAGVQCTAYVADVEDEKALERAFAYAKADLGTIDVVEYSPCLPKGNPLVNAVATTSVPAAAEATRVGVLGAIATTRQVLPEMLERKAGALLFTTCGVSLRPSPSQAPASIASAALRTYALCLYSDLAAKGVYAAHVSIGMELKPGTEGDPARVAQLYVALAERRDRPELAIAPAAAPAA